jgi:hypothetical protein
MQLAREIEIVLESKILEGAGGGGQSLHARKYTIRPDIHDRASLEANFREKFEALNRVKLTDGEFERLLDEIITEITLVRLPAP